jgi:GcrA cell cycle regulator
MAPVTMAPPSPPVAKAAPMRVLSGRGGRLTVCCWPIGEPGTENFRFCDADAVPGKPYCAQHAELAYVRVRDRREDAA